MTLIEVLLAASIVLVTAGITVPAVLETDRAMKLRSAAAFITGHLQRVRLDALNRSAAIGIRFRAQGNDWRLASFLDGNGNGVRHAEIASGVDTSLDQEASFAAHCPSVRIALLAAVPDVNGSLGGSAVRFGSEIATFDRDGSASSGSVYLTDGRSQLAVTVTGATGRVRVRRWDARRRIWERMH